MINYSTREFVESIIGKSNTKPKDMWEKSKQFLKTKSVSATKTYLKIDGELITDTEYMANAFNDFFLAELDTNMQRNLTIDCLKLNNIGPRVSFSIQTINVV